MCTGAPRTRPRLRADRRPVARADPRRGHTGTLYPVPVYNGHARPASGSREGAAGARRPRPDGSVKRGTAMRRLVPVLLTFVMGASLPAWAGDGVVLAVRPNGVVIDAAQLPELQRGARVGF